MTLCDYTANNKAQHYGVYVEARKEKICNKCGKKKPFAQYSKAASTRDKKRGECKQCAACVGRKWRENNREHERSLYHKRHYNIEYGQFQQMLETQGGVCAICHKPEMKRSMLSVDHDHRCCPYRNKSCGMCIRGLICTYCNAGLAAFRDEPRLLEAAMKYLQQEPA